MNAGSGADDKDDSRAKLEQGFGESGHRVQFHLIDKADDIEATIAQAKQACEADGGVLVAAGGDGTINATASAAAGSEIPFAVVPMGTFNYFARDIGMPADPKDAALAIAGGTVQPFHIARINGHPFLVNASIGLYVKLIQNREKYRGTLGGRRAAAVVSGLLTALRGHAAMALDMKVDGKQRSLRTALVFLGKNYLQLKNLDFDIAEGIAAGQVGVIVLRDAAPRTLLGLAWRALRGRPEDTPKLHAFCTESLEIKPRRARIDVVLDGEIMTLKSPLKVTIDKNALQLVRPHPADSEAEKNSLAKAES